MTEFRRPEHHMEDMSEIEDVLQQSEYGFLGLAAGDDGYPAVIPVNYVYHQDRIYLHGSPVGEKIRALGRDNRVTFVVVQAYSLIPSYFRHPRKACPATQYYKSVMIRGRACLVADLDEKASVLEALMAKLQPEGGYQPIIADDSLYRAQIKGTAVIRIDVEAMTAKFKFGQNLRPGARREIMERLEERGNPVDQQTIEAIRRYNQIEFKNRTCAKVER